MACNKAKLFIDHLIGNGHCIGYSKLTIVNNKARVYHYKKRKVVISQGVVTSHIGIVIEGVLASEFINNDESSISRFFCEEDLWANLGIVFQSKYASDILFSIAQAKALNLPFKPFEETCLGSEYFGLYLRKRLLLNTRATKKIISIKSKLVARVKHEILEKDLPWLIEIVPQKISQVFLGLHHRATVASSIGKLVRRCFHPLILA